MNLSSLNLKLIIGITYLGIISISLYFIFSAIDLKDLLSYDFIRSNQDIILKYKSGNFLFLSTVFFIISVIWVLLLGFVSPLLLFSGFIFGKWWGILIALTATTIGSTFLYILAGFLFKEIITQKLTVRFYRLKELFIKNDIIYFTLFRLAGGGGMPYAIQNVLPILFDMKIKNYMIATFIGSIPAMFVTVALGSGVQNVIDQNTNLSISSVLLSSEIYIPIIGFFIILIIAFAIKKFYFK
jgi:uncharacterized membrane protein YdjX (TVP38/TMEM64 family)